MAKANETYVGNVFEREAFEPGQPNLESLINCWNRFVDQMVGKIFGRQGLLCCGREKPSKYPGETAMRRMLFATRSENKLPPSRANKSGIFKVELPQNNGVGR